jgi:L-asparaginase / beta-aspartyl-peptidase
MNTKIAIAVHGGAGNFEETSYTPEEEAIYKEVLSAALDAGYNILRKGGNSADAVVAAVKLMEDSPYFNAGKGSVFTHEGKNEMDASIMTGKDLKCGAVTCVRRIKNPISAAQRVMDKSHFVLLSSEGAEKFALDEGLELADASYFFTPARWQQLAKIKDTGTVQLGNDPKGDLDGAAEATIEKFGTVGCVAIDEDGNLAAATSTGGLVNKEYNRIGDSPIIGAGTYANNKTCAVSCTGGGEEFIRIVAAYDISCLMEYRKVSLKRATEEVILKKLKAIGGHGGCIGIDLNGSIIMTFTTLGMFRGSIDRDGRKMVAMYKDPA